jgi:hypothetical protein
MLLSGRCAISADRRASVLVIAIPAATQNGYSGREWAPGRYRQGMGEEAPRPQVFPSRFAGAASPGDISAGHDRCSCFDFRRVQVPAPEVRFHGERQDTAAPGWLRMLALIEEAAADGREVFAPLAGMSPEERRQVITLPPSVARLTAVKHLVLYRSNLVRLPPQIGEMASLKIFEPYASPRLHWFPYELTRCPNLKFSTVSTRRVYGN